MICPSFMIFRLHSQNLPYCQDHACFLSPVIEVLGMRNKNHGVCLLMADDVSADDE